jgi:hypothetical protein
MKSLNNADPSIMRKALLELVLANCCDKILVRAVRIPKGSLMI